MALLTGFIAAYPINWWLVANHLKHGMMTVRPPHKEHEAEEPMQNSDKDEHSSHESTAEGHDNGNEVDADLNKSIWIMIIVSFVVLAAGVSFALMY